MDKLSCSRLTECFLTRIGTKYAFHLNECVSYDYLFIKLKWMKSVFAIRCVLNVVVSFLPTSVHLSQVWKGLKFLWNNVQ